MGEMMKRAYEPKEIADAIEWLQDARSEENNKFCIERLDIIIDCLDDALELANSRQDEIEQHEPEEGRAPDGISYRTVRSTHGADPQHPMAMSFLDPIKGTGFQPEEFDEDKRTSNLVEER
jgi:hypothetical protein